MAHLMHAWVLNVPTTVEESMAHTDFQFRLPGVGGLATLLGVYGGGVWVLRGRGRDKET